MESIEMEESKRYKSTIGATEDKLLSLIEDESWIVRGGVASRGFTDHLDILVNDSEWAVRAVVARVGHRQHLEQLKMDKNSAVKLLAIKRLKESTVYM